MANVADLFMLVNSSKQSQTLLDLVHKALQRFRILIVLNLKNPIRLGSVLRVITKPHLTLISSSLVKISGVDLAQQMLQPHKKRISSLRHLTTYSESCKRQIAEDLKNEKPVWKLTCYSHSRNGPCDIVGDISYEELRAVVYDEVKRGTSIQSIVERERSLLSSKLIEFENLLRNPYPSPQNSTLTTQNAFSGTNIPSLAPGFSQVGTNFNSGANTNVFSQTIQKIGPTPVTSFSQLNTNFNTSFQMSPAAPNYASGPVSQFQAPTQISTPSQNSFAFGNPGQLSSQPSQQSSVSSFPASTSSFTNSFPVAATSQNLDSVHQQPSGLFGVQNPSANVPPGAVSSLQMTQNLPSASSKIDNSIWLKDKWRAGEIPEEAPPDEVVC